MIIKDPIFSQYITLNYNIKSETSCNFFLSIECQDRFCVNAIFIYEKI